MNTPHDTLRWDWEKLRVDLSDKPAENTRRYLEYIIEQCCIPPENIGVLHNLACGDAEEAPVLEELFPRAKIIAIEKDEWAMSWARHSSEKCKRTTFLQKDLYDEKVWKTLPKADMVLLQQPQLSWMEHRMYIENWIPRISKSLNAGGIFIICLMYPWDLSGFYEESIYVGEKNPAETVDRYFDTILDEENPYGDHNDYYWIMAFRKKSRKPQAAKEVTQILDWKKK